jgi:hypothetical protein
MDLDLLYTHERLNGLKIIIYPDAKQRRKHRKRRINKKWAKRYGYTTPLVNSDSITIVPSENNEYVLMMSNNTYLKLKENSEMINTIGETISKIKPIF